MAVFVTFGMSLCSWEWRWWLSCGRCGRCGSGGTRWQQLWLVHTLFTCPSPPPARMGDGQTASRPTTAACLFTFADGLHNGHEPCSAIRPCKIVGMPVLASTYAGGGNGFGLDDRLRSG